MVFGYGSSTNLTELMRIQGNGNVGIGTKNPTYKLDLAGRLRLRQASGTAGIYFDGITCQPDLLSVPWMMITLGYLVV